MHARVVTVSGARNIDVGVSFVRERVLPLVRQYPGYRGMTVTTNREDGVILVMTSWDSAEQREANSAAMPITRAQLDEVFGGQIRVEHMEELLVEKAGASPDAGSWLVVAPLRIDPEDLDATIDAVRTTGVTAALSRPGFLGLSLLADRDAGRAVLLAASADRASLAAHPAGFGIPTASSSLHEVVLVDR